VPPLRQGGLKHWQDSKNASFASSEPALDHPRQPVNPTRPPWNIAWVNNAAGHFGPRAPLVLHLHGRMRSEKNRNRALALFHAFGNPNAISGFCAWEQTLQEAQPIAIPQILQVVAKYGATPTSGGSSLRGVVRHWLAFVREGGKPLATNILNLDHAVLTPQGPSGAPSRPTVGALARFCRSNIKDAIHRSISRRPASKCSMNRIP